MPISSYILRCTPAHHAGILKVLETIPGIEAGAPTDQGIPIVAATSSNREATEVGERLLRIPGVRDAVLVYHHFEDVLDAPSGDADSGGPVSSAEDQPAHLPMPCTTTDANS